MVEYIKREDALKIIRQEGINQAEQYANRHHPVVMAYGDCFGKIKSLPTTEVEEVKHGHWIKTDRGVRNNPITGEPMRVYACDCSCCGWHTGNQGVEFKRCPMCGAIMDGRSDT